MYLLYQFPGGLVVRIRRSHRRGRGSIPRLGRMHFLMQYLISHSLFTLTVRLLLGGMSKEISLNNGHINYPSWAHVITANCYFLGLKYNQSLYTCIAIISTNYECFKTVICMFFLITRIFLHVSAKETV